MLSRALALTGLTLLSISCSSVIWNQDFFQTGRALEPGWTQIDGNGWVVVPSRLAVQHGFENGWVVRAHAGLDGTYNPYPPPSNGDPDFPPRFLLTAAGLGIEKSLVDNSPWHASASADVSGFVSNLDFQSSVISGLQGVAGLTASFYPTDWFGVNVPLRMTALVAATGTDR